MDSEGSNNEIKMKEFFEEDFSDIEKKIESEQEKPYYELNEISKAKKNKEKKNYLSNQHLVEKKIDKYDDKELQLLKTSFNLLIQFKIILIFTLLGFIYEINEAFIKSKGAIYGTLIPTTIIILSMCYSFHFIPDSNRSDYWLYIYPIIYIPCIVFYCFLLSKYTDNKNILCGLILYILDILTYIITILIFKKIYYILFSIFSSIITVITLLIFHYA